MSMAKRKISQWWLVCGSCGDVPGGGFDPIQRAGAGRPTGGQPLPHLSAATATGANAGFRPAPEPCAIRVAVVSKPPARRLLAAPDLLLLGSVAGALKLHDLALAERQHGSLVRRLTVSGDTRQHDDMVAVGDKVLRLGPEGLAGQCDEELPDFVLAAIGAADRAVARH